MGKNVKKIIALIKKISYKKDFLAILILVLTICLFLVPTFTQKDLCCDFVGQTVPWYHFLLTSIKSGTIPFWSPYAYTGFPFLFTPSLAIFHPLTLLIILLNFIFNFHNPSIEITGKIIQYVFVLASCIGGIGMYALCRKLFNLSKFTALFAGLTFSLNPYWLHATHVVWMAWAFNSLPWIFLFLTLFLSRPTFKLFLLVTFCNVLVFATGYPYYYVYFLLAEVFLAILYGPKKTILFFLSLLNTLLLSGFFLLPYLSIMLGSARSESVYDFTFHSFASLFPTSVLLILNPLTYSANIYKYPNVSDLFTGVMPTWGTFVFLFLIYGLFFLKNKPIYRWAVIIFFISLFYSFGANLSAHSFFGTLLPIIYKFRSHNQVLSLTIFTGVLFIGLGVEAISKRLRVKYVDMAFWFICLSVFIGLTLGPVFFWNKIAGTAEFYKGTSIMFLFLFTSLIIVALATKYGKKSFLILGLVVMLIEYHYYFQNFQGFFTDNVTYEQFYKMNSTVLEIPSANNLFRVYFQQTRFSYNTSMIKVYSLEGYENNVPTVYGNLLSQYGGFSKLFQVTNVKYIVSAQNSLDKDRLLSKIKTINPANYPDEFLPSEYATSYYIYKVKDYVPRFYIPNKVDPCLDSKCWKEENIPQLVIVRGITRPIVNPIGGTKIDVKKYDLNSIEMEITTPKMTFIASSEAYDKGWTLTINNKPSEIYYISNGLRGFIVPAGKSIVKMSYFPTYLFQGLMASIFGILMLVVIYKKRIFLKEYLTEKIE